MRMDGGEEYARRFVVRGLKRAEEAKCKAGHGQRKERLAEYPRRKNCRKLTVVLQELLDQVDVGEDHSPTAVTLETELGEGGSFLHSAQEQCQVGVPLVADDLAARKATDGDDHGCCLGSLAQ